MNVNRVKNFEEVKKQEMAMERSRMENIKKMSFEENRGSIPVSLYAIKLYSTGLRYMIRFKKCIMISNKTDAMVSCFIE